MRLLTVSALVLVMAAVSADERSAVVGRWASDRSIVEVAETEGTLSMTVVALKNPLYLDSEDFGEPGQPRLDRNNPEEQLRSQPILGLELLKDYVFEKGRWQGKVYDPESGKTYSSNMRVDDGQLIMRGYIGTPMLGRTRKFDPVASCMVHVVEMLAKAGLESCQ